MLQNGWYDITLEYKRPSSDSSFTFTGQVGSVVETYEGVMMGELSSTKECVHRYSVYVIGAHTRMVPSTHRILFAKSPGHMTLNG